MSLPARNPDIKIKENRVISIQRFKDFLIPWHSVEYPHL